VRYTENQGFQSTIKDTMKLGATFQVKSSCFKKHYSLPTCASSTNSNATRLRGLKLIFPNQSRMKQPQERSLISKNEAQYTKNIYLGVRSSLLFIILQSYFDLQPAQLRTLTNSGAYMSTFF
jgi:hypothetical protein